LARVGILGGTFDPPHIGHLLCASEACDQLQLDEVVLMPTHTPPHKAVATGAPTPAERAELCALAVEGDPRLSVSRLEVERGGASYTVDTLRTLREQRPGDDLVFIVGADTALSLPTWRDPETIAGLASLGVAGRQGLPRRDVVERLAGLPVRLEFFDMPRFDVSSSEIRRRLAAGQAIDYLVPPRLAAHLRESTLYRPGVPA